MGQRLAGRASAGHALPPLLQAVPQLPGWAVMTDGQDILRGWGSFVQQLKLDD